MEDYPCDVIRNFSIIAHIDHGKSTLADRLLEVIPLFLKNVSMTKKEQQLTGTINKKVSGGKNEQVLDKLKVERERGITAQTARYAIANFVHPNIRELMFISMIHKFNGKDYLLNLIDTPGHVDFAWEVSRSLAACQGAVLLVDASQGVQAQSISVFHNAKERGLKIIPVLNKIDLPASQPERIAAQMQSTFGIDPSEILHISAKTGKGVDAVLAAIIDRIPPPVASADSPLKAFLFDSMYDKYRGVISLVSVQGGVLRKGDKIASCYTRKKYEITELGIMYPEEIPTKSLNPGQVGYIACNMKQSSEAHIGDTIHRVGETVEPMAGFQPTKAMVFAGVYPIDNSDFPKLEESINRLTLTDRSVTVQRESSSALGQGCRLGFLGTLHMDVFRQRLEDEYDANVIITAPTVPYKLIYKDKEVLISNPTDFPDVGDMGVRVKEVQEPVVKASIIVPEEYFGDMMELCYSHRGEDLEHRYLDSGTTSARIMLNCILPLSEIVTDFFDQLKSRSSGFASFDYEDAGYRSSDLAKMVFLLNGKPVDALALIVHRSAQDAIGRQWVKKLHKVIPKQLFEVPIQAAVGKKVIARETLKAMRADVTAGLYGGHYERKMKHLENQKEGKRKMKKMGTVDLPQEAFFEILSNKK
ncbi:Translation factor guf1 mitochondrial [Psilocybe cubensis]|uniref:Translation factor guf1 mitochondrial n=2 Tax=Psilocybe cubensis TaxID=181762 RepID=A0ACB8H896_PSICU|nr:Translation factor guf1 mitochondrial [Psilocybe cubensis]KAH9483887.1 Translation factor guf1 mitochondrial [Psilocybe cubensis]